MGKRTNLKNQRHALSVWLAGKSIVVICILLGVACGKVGPPIFPEDIGLAVKLEESRSKKTSGTVKSESEFSQIQNEHRKGRDRVPQEGEVVLPPLRSLGSQ